MEDDNAKQQLTQEEVGVKIRVKAGQNNPSQKFHKISFVCFCSHFFSKKKYLYERKFSPKIIDLLSVFAENLRFDIPSHDFRQYSTTLFFLSLLYLDSIASFTETRCFCKF